MLDAINDTSLMIVEDDDALRDRLARAMDRRGFDVRVASSLSEAMVQADTELPKYAVVDLRLQDGSGLSFVETLEQRDPNIRAIILTGLRQHSDRRRRSASWCHRLHRQACNSRRDRGCAHQAQKRTSPGPIQSDLTRRRPQRAYRACVP